MEMNIFQIIWYVLWGVLWAVYFALDGFDLGAGSLLYFLGKDEKERRVVYQAVGPFWDGNEVWLITAGGATFAAFPTAYAVMFSALYTPLLLLLFSLILRGVAVEYRNKHESLSWRNFWDFLFFLGSFLPALLLGVAFANIFKGVPIDEKGLLQTNLFGLLNPYGLLGGLLFVFCFATHGALWVAFKAPSPFSERAANLAKKTWVVTLLLVILFWIISFAVTNMWANFLKAPLLIAFPLLAALCYLMVPVFLNKGAYFKAWAFSALTIVLFTAWGVAGLFPNILPSSINPAYSLTLVNSSSSPLTLKIMTTVAILFVPIVLAYTFWAYKTFSYKITKEDISY
ncbi:cytochrome C oxidase assembly protein [Caldimicrobium thiodismutans]|uniref:Cytochrome C oxidase assembly protein n=1 Tax=Caldimicrobium thiodismutans TaxID=1653476 RepID=A0A0U5AY16_9BACT|nr:cytochrome d ubiquinol oxidase subunit II [Caldimicrobium thiodismutans]BAU23359.1 cytochrome C oxidase assembly protein [Caldimicrobium thiodismutans]